jgi:hypothetical protein
VRERYLVANSRSVSNLTGNSFESFVNEDSLSQFSLNCNSISLLHAIWKR